MGQVNQKIAGQITELEIDKEQLEDTVDALRDQVRANEERLQRVVREKREDMSMVKEDFVQVIET